MQRCSVIMGGFAMIITLVVMHIYQPWPLGIAAKRTARRFSVPMIAAFHIQPEKTGFPSAYERGMGRDEQRSDTPEKIPVPTFWRAAGIPARFLLNITDITVTAVHAPAFSSFAACWLPRLPPDERPPTSGRPLPILRTRRRNRRLRFWQAAGYRQA